jgi:hypothetical protein
VIEEITEAWSTGVYKPEDFTTAKKTYVISSASR